MVRQGRPPSWTLVVAVSHSQHRAECSHIAIATVGSDVRKLVKDGYPASHVIGCDLRQEFIDYGYKLYDDRERCQIRFFPDDIFGIPYPPTSLTAVSESTGLASLAGQLDHIYTGALFHLFDEATQYALALRLTTLLKREPGAVVFGRHQGLEKEGLIDDHMSRYLLACCMFPGIAC